MVASAPGIQPEGALLLRRRVAQSPTWLPVVGGSMGRTIRTGSEVLVAASSEPRFGEIWAFLNDEGVLVVHRFSRRRGEQFYFQGDAHWPDPPVAEGQLVGRVLRTRYRGRERGFGGADRLLGGSRLMLRRGSRALAIRLGMRRVRDLTQGWFRRQ